MNLFKNILLIMLFNAFIITLCMCEILKYDNTTLYNYIKNQELINIVKTNKIGELEEELGIIEYKNKIYQYVSDNSVLSDNDINKLVNYSVDTSNEYNIDPLLVISLMKNESNFKKNVKSKSGAKGLLQITPIAEKEVIDYYDNIPDNIIIENEMHKNIFFAISYFNILLSKYKDISIALESYKIGPSKMDSILNNNKNFKVRSIYVNNILSTYANIRMICLSE